MIIKINNKAKSSDYKSFAILISIDYNDGNAIFMSKNMNLIFKFRNDVGLSQESLAKAVGVSQSAISQIERGEKKPSVDLAMRLISFAKDQGKSFKLEDFYASRNDSIEHAN